MRTESYLVGYRDRIEPVKSLQGPQVKVKSLSAQRHAQIPASSLNCSYPLVFLSQVLS